MIPPQTLLRDAAFAASLAIAVAFAFDAASGLGGASGLGVAAGAIAGLANLVGWIFAAQGILRGGMAQGLLAVKVIGGVGLVLALATIVPVSPLVFGFMAPLGGIAVRGVLGIPSLRKAA